MNTTKLAEMLNVDELSLMHGPKGVAAHVRIEKSWHSVTIDNDEMDGKKTRIEVIAEKLITLSDGICKSFGRKNDLVKAEPQPAQRSRMSLSWQDVGGWTPWDNEQSQRPQRQIQRTTYEAPPPPSPVQPYSEPTVSKSMPSRFHAIVAELSKL